MLVNKTLYNNFMELNPNCEYTFEQWHQMYFGQTSEQRKQIKDSEYMSIEQIRLNKNEAVKSHDWETALYWRQVEKLKMNNGQL